MAWVRDAARRDVTLLRDEWLTAALYRVAWPIGLDIGEPLEWTDVSHQ